MWIWCKIIVEKKETRTIVHCCVVHTVHSHSCISYGNSISTNLHLHTIVVVAAYYIRFALISFKEFGSNGSDPPNERTHPLGVLKAILGVCVNVHT